ALEEGSNAISLTATDVAGQTSPNTLIVYRVTSAPSVDAWAEQNGQRVTRALGSADSPEVDITGTATTANLGGVNGLRYIRINGQPVTPGLNGAFELLDQALNVGANLFVIEAEDEAGNIATASVSVTYNPIIESVTLSYNSLILGGVAVLLLILGLFLGRMMFGGQKPPEPEIAPMPAAEEPMAPAMEAPSPEELPSPTPTEQPPQEGMP
ncbi:MAG TPA: hypothetical protein VJ259_07995, partial [Actinomycetota bacterium]|nr:hypothetical protein [Actinomycetota bacterium]